LLNIKEKFLSFQNMLTILMFRSSILSIKLGLKIVIFSQISQIKKLDILLEHKILRLKIGFFFEKLKKNA